MTRHAQGGTNNFCLARRVLWVLQRSGLECARDSVNNFLTIYCTLLYIATESQPGAFVPERTLYENERKTISVHSARGLDGSLVAIKSFTKCPENIPLFAIESRIMKMLRGCPYVVQLIQTIDTPDFLHIVMEFAPNDLVDELSTWKVIRLPAHFFRPIKWWFDRRSRSSNIRRTPHRSGAFTRKRNRSP